ncbi:probable LRR receptor-like serine/threonine-protein kinase At1g07650 [Cynara cardunculus var. scolymus]|uniref:probable LRR receptor-like serine/threonine-protein kinase At1g07650 n=1 Tax=Cynara cardunculus var. scolymus TaxID=59895 RepID=UPI000D62F61C|nr:probable LRR receptor-like serine/threonine-protein kinase At1g07650 [Cynara cardunculus var. scolymus]
MMFDPSSRLLLIFMLIVSTFLFFLVTGIQAQARNLPPDEVNALRDIAKELQKKDWDFSLNPCDRNPNWVTPLEGRVPQFENSVLCTCSDLDDACHIVSISVKGQDLAGFLPPSLAKLPSIKFIDLSFNYLNGTIPLEWASTKLENLSVTANRLSGSIPTFLGSITSLRDVRLENNMFSGPVPPALGKLTSLTTLVLSANKLTGTLPGKLKSMTSLKELRLSSNNFSGKMPSLEGWTQLEELEIQGSGLEGPIPPSISLLSKLTELAISDLFGEGSQFPNLINMTSMKKLMLRSCNISGTIPAYVSRMSQLAHLDLSFNNLEGRIPDLQELPLERMYLTGNSFSGSVPDWLKEDYKQKVDLSYNNFSENTVPQKCHDSLNLFRSYSGGKNLDLAKCLGIFPCSNKHQSVHINCGGPGATVGNKFYEADQEPGGAAKFVPLIKLWGTSSTGSLYNVKGTSDEYIASNVSVVTNGSELYTTARLSPLSLTYYGRCLANGNYTVTLHFAEIFFTANESYQSLGVRAFDIYVQGENKFKNFDIKSEAGGVNKAVNKTINNVAVTNNTLEIRFQYAGKGTTAVPHRGVYGPMVSAISMESDFKPPNSKMKIFIVIGTVVTTLCLILIVLGIAWQGGYMGDQISREKELRGLDLQTGVFTYRQIRAATDNFSALNKLGEGGFGSVYKGTLLDGTLVAVKQLSSTSRQGNREFVNEIGMIAGIRHPNIVRLHGCCVEGDHLLLLYEYMENNSLAHALFEQDKSKMEINWSTRQRICIGIAKGLAFLHEESVLRMVHRDIKATNILLDTNLTPKISDFGLAKLDEEHTHIVTKVAGTLGYMAPEYALWGLLTYKADVYSFGVLALEIVAGKNNMKFRPSEDCFCLLDWAIVLEQKGSLIDLVDPRLGSDFNKKEAVGMIKIALLCTNQSPDLRPSMSEVVNMLEGCTKIREPNNTYDDDEFRFQAFASKFEVMHSQDSEGPETLTDPTSSSSHDLYSISQISEVR